MKWGASEGLLLVEGLATTRGVRHTDEFGVAMKLENDWTRRFYHYLSLSQVAVWVCCYSCALSANTIPVWICCSCALFTNTRPVCVCCYSCAVHNILPAVLPAASSEAFRSHNNDHPRSFWHRHSNIPLCPRSPRRLQTAVATFPGLFPPPRCHVLNSDCTTGAEVVTRLCLEGCRHLRTEKPEYDWLNQEMSWNVDSIVSLALYLLE